MDYKPMDVLKNVKKWYINSIKIYYHMEIYYGLYGDGSKPCYLVNPEIAGKWMSIPLKMVLIGIDPYPYIKWYHILYKP